MRSLGDCDVDLAAKPANTLRAVEAPAKETRAQRTQRLHEQQRVLHDSWIQSVASRSDFLQKPMFVGDRYEGALNLSHESRERLRHRGFLTAAHVVAATEPEMGSIEPSIVSDVARALGEHELSFRPEGCTLPTWLATYSVRSELHNLFGAWVTVDDLAEIAMLSASTIRERLALGLAPEMVIASKITTAASMRGGFTHHQQTPLERLRAFRRDRVLAIAAQSAGRADVLPPQSGRGRRRKYGAATERRIVDLTAEGLTQRDIGAALRMPAVSVGRIAKRLGAKRTIGPQSGGARIRGAIGRVTAHCRVHEYVIDVDAVARPFTDLEGKWAAEDAQDRPAPETAKQAKRRAAKEARERREAELLAPPPEPPPPPVFPVSPGVDPRKRRGRQLNTSSLATRVVAFILRHPGCTTKEIETALEEDHRQVSRQLAVTTWYGRIARVGPFGRGRYYPGPRAKETAIVMGLEAAPHCPPGPKEFGRLSVMLPKRTLAMLEGVARDRECTIDEVLESIIVTACSEPETDAE